MPPAAAGDAQPGRKAHGFAVIRRVLPFLWKEEGIDVKRRVLMALGFLAAAKLANVLTPLFFKMAVDTLGEQGIEERALLLSIPIWLVLAYGFSRFGHILFNQLRDAVFTVVAQRGLRRLALQTFAHVHALSLRYHLERKTGGLSRVIERGVKGIDFLLRFMVLSIIPLLLELILVAVIFFYALDDRFFWIIAVTIVAYVWFTLQMTEWRVKIREQMNNEDTAANQKAVDSLLNYETVKVFTAEEREGRRYDQSMEGYETAAVKTYKTLAWLNGGQGVIITIGMMMAMGLAARGVLDGALSVGDFVMVNAYMIQLTMPLNFLGTVYREIRQALVDMGDMFGLLDQPVEVADAPGAPALEVEGGGVTFEDVHFGYNPDRDILKGVSLSVAPGKTLAVVGPSGAGKSTIARLLCRFYDVTGGAIRIDGQDIRRVTQTSLRGAIGVVPEDTVLFNDTIGYNIGYGAEGATREAVERAAKAARVHDFIMGLPQGYDTMVGERGLKLSGGEKQRVAIARTILKNPPILILDEATSALDSQTESEIQSELTELGRDRTVIVVAHRLSTVVQADEIAVLVAGRVEERGSHADLLARGGRYAAMWRMQQEGGDIDGAFAATAETV
jgi:ATP-binding cassette subfamily B protein